MAKKKGIPKKMSYTEALDSEKVKAMLVVAFLSGKKFTDPAMSSLNTLLDRMSNDKDVTKADLLAAGASETEAEFAAQTQVVLSVNSVIITVNEPQAYNVGSC